MYYVSKRTGWVIFADIHYVLYLCWVGQKKSKNMLTYYRNGHIKECIIANSLKKAKKNLQSFILRQITLSEELNLHFFFIVFDQKFNLYQQFLVSFIRSSKLLNGYPSATFQNETTQPCIGRSELSVVATGLFY